MSTNTRGQFKIKINERKGEAKFRLQVLKGQAVTAAHLHCALPGQNGPVVAFLFGNIPGGFAVNGKLSQFRMTDANLAAVAESCDDVVIDSLEDLADAIDKGLIYVNVHTVANPAGEVRGQL